MKTHVSSSASEARPSATVTIRTHGRCAVDGCNRGRRAAIEPGETWHLMLSFVLSPERRSESVHAWAEACAQHRAEALSALSRDAAGIVGMPWRITVATYNYADSQDTRTVVVAETHDGSQR